MSKQSKGLVKKIVCFACAVILIAVAIVVPIVLNMFDSMLSIIFGAKELDSATRAEGETLAVQIEEEGIIMVKNDDCLPLQESDVKNDGVNRVNVFGWAATDWLMGGSGSGRSVNGSSSNLSPATDLLKALNEYKVFSDDGIEYNTELTNFYENYKSGRDNKATNTLNSHDYESCVLYEPAMSAYTDTLKQNAMLYSDVALVVLGRITGESNDAPKVQYKYKASTDEGRTYLDISTEEEDLLEYVGKTFEKVVVIINSTNTMNLEFMDRIEGLDACLIVGGTGNNAASAVPNILFGKKEVKTEKTDEDGNVVKDSDGNVVYDTEIVNVSPSGKTVDTYAYDFKTNANWAYSGLDGVQQYNGTSSSLYPLTVTNLNVGDNSEKYPGVSYLDYAEGIYVGYKWYETADAEGYWDDVNNEYGKGYDGVVQYPFGYGLTYTEFEWDVGVWEVKDGKISVTVQVTNTGDYPAQEVVEMYYTPYYNKITSVEKASVNLCAFAKTPVAVEPSESMELELSFEIQDMASYDQDKDDGAYVLENGDYIVSLRTDAHTVIDAKNATYTYNPKQEVVYNTYSGENGVNEISNLFTGDNVSDGIAVDGSDTENGIENVWLSRADFAGTFHSEQETARYWNSELNANNIYTSDAANAWDAAWLTEYIAENGSEPVFTQGEGNAYKLYSDDFTEDAYFFGNPENYDADEWETLLNQLTTEEMKELVAHGYCKEAALNSIGKPQTVSVDGPAQIGSFNQSNPGVGYPMPTVIAQTWNEELAKSFGLAVGTETLASGRDGWYAPGVNLHRSAFGGRNYEYYSEDSYLSGVMCTATVRGALNAGVYTYIKHFIGYDQESYRDGLYCWMTEQTLRETYLRPFKMAIDKGATGLMTSYGRLGSVWSGGSESLLTDLLRDEWGFKGAVLTDYADHQTFMNGDQMLRAGGDLWMDGYQNNGLLRYTTSVAYNAKLREASKHVIYMWANAAYEAQQYAETDDSISITRASKDMFKWWWAAAIGADVVFVAGAGALVFVALKKPKNKKKDESAE